MKIRLDYEVLILDSSRTTTDAPESGDDEVLSTWFLESKKTTGLTVWLCFKIKGNIFFISVFLRLFSVNWLKFQVFLYFEQENDSNCFL